MVLSLVFVGCSFTPKKTPGAKSIDHVDLQKFQRGSEYIDKKEYKKAIEVFESLLVENPASQMDLLVLYNMGMAYNELGNCEKAVDYFGQTAQASEGQFFEIEAQAVLRLGYSYECLKRDDKVVISFMKARRKKKYLPKEVGLAEIPARLGAAYVRLGNRELASQFFGESEKGTRSLRNDKKDLYRQKKLLARTFFFMGRVNIFSLVSMKDLDSLRYQQLYLLKAAEMDNKMWSEKAVRHLVGIYDHLWEMVNQEARLPSSQAEVRKLRDQQVRLASGALRNIQRLKKQRFPDKNETRLVSGLFAILGQHEKKFTSFLTRRIGEGGE